MNDLDYDDDDTDYEDYRTAEQREDEDIYIESRGGIDKCMNCGKYKFNDELNYSPQVCKKQCQNPREY